MDFFTVDRYIARRVKAEFYAVASYRKDDQFNVLANDDSLFCFPTENEHFYAFRANRTLRSVHFHLVIDDYAAVE